MQEEKKNNIKINIVKKKKNLIIIRRFSSEIEKRKIAWRINYNPQSEKYVRVTVDRAPRSVLTQVPWKRKGEDDNDSTMAKTETWRGCSCIIGLWFRDGIYKVCSTWRASSTSELSPPHPKVWGGDAAKRVIIVVIYIPGVPLMRLGFPYWKILRSFRIKATARPRLSHPPFPTFSFPLPLSIALWVSQFSLGLRYIFSFPSNFNNNEPITMHPSFSLLSIATRSFVYTNFISNIIDFCLYLIRFIIPFVHYLLFTFIFFKYSSELELRAQSVINLLIELRL